MGMRKDAKSPGADKGKGRRKLTVKETLKDLSPSERQAKGVRGGAYKDASSTPEGGR